MIRLYTAKEFDNTKSRGLLPLQCEICKHTFYKSRNAIKSALNPNQTTTLCFCSNKCQHLHTYPPHMVTCRQCRITLRKSPSQIKRSKSGNHFCSKSCAGKWNSAHKKHGTRRSKLEKWLEEQLTKLYPDLEIHFNRKDTINSELDIFVPSLKLAFELNGIFHYEPIFGPEKLASIQNNDERKMQACHEQGIEFCTIDVSSLTYFKPKKVQKYLDIITSILNTKLSS